MSEFVQSWSSIYFTIFSESRFRHGKSQRSEVTIPVQVKIRLPSELNWLGFQCQPHWCCSHLSFLSLQRMEIKWVGLRTKIQQIYSTKQNFSFICIRSTQGFKNYMFSTWVLGWYCNVSIYFYWSSMWLSSKIIAF